MNIAFFAVLAGSVFFISACNNDSKDTNTSENVKESPATKPETEKAPDNESKAVNELCACFNSYMANMSPRVKRIIIDAEKSSHPEQVLAAELQKMESADEQQRLAMEFEQFQNSDQLQQCSANIQRKYQLNENDSAARDRILKIAGSQKDCEVVYALMKIGFSQQATRPPANN